MVNDAKITIIGAGVIGLALAYELSKKYEDIFILEKNSKFGQETSCRSSEVIHSGIYYPRGSLKARLCLEGRRLLYEFCNENKINYNKCGKLIVANSKEEEIQLDILMQQSIFNGISGVRKIQRREINELEPNINAVSAIFLSETGIFDSYGYMKALETLIVNNHSQIVYESEIIGLSKVKGGYTLSILEKNGTIFKFNSEFVINAAGLNSDKISEMLGIDRLTNKLHYWKGEYFAVGNGKNKMINRLVYPLPNKNITGLGVHATIDLSGGLKLGPNIIYLKNKELDYSVDKKHKMDFFNAVVEFMPFIEEKDLYPGESGIRPKLQGEGDSFRDFIIKEEKEAGYENYINLIGIESPGLTASLAIAKAVDKILNI